MKNFLLSDSSLKGLGSVEVDVIVKGWREEGSKCLKIEYEKYNY